MFLDTMEPRAENKNSSLEKTMGSDMWEKWIEKNCFAIVV